MVLRLQQPAEREVNAVTCIHSMVAERALLGYMHRMVRANTPAVK